jgi:hypothetical protein
VSEAGRSARRRSSVETRLVSSEHVRLFALSGRAQSPLEMTRLTPLAYAEVALLACSRCRSTP